MESRLYRNSAWYRPLYVMIKDKEYCLDNIIVYDNNGILAEVGRGFFECDKELIIKGEIVRKLKTIFSTKENYIVKIPKNYIGDENRYCLYIYVDNVDFKDLGKYKQYNSIYNKYSINGLEFDIYIQDLSKKMNELNTLAENEVKKLTEFFGYSREGVEESSLLEIFKKLQDLNRQILNEKKYIEDYKV